MPVSTAPVCALTVLGWRLAALPLTDLWWRYVALGGDRRHPAFAAYLAGTAEWSSVEHNVLAHAVNEGLWDVGCPSLAPYREPQLSCRSRPQLPLVLPVERSERP